MAAGGKGEREPSGDVGANGHNEVNGPKDAEKREPPKGPDAPDAPDAEGVAPSIVVVDPGRMNLLGLLLSSMLARRLSEPRAIRHARALRGDVRIDASGMQVTLRFGPSRIEITREPSAHPHARVAGTLTALLGAALGRGRVRSVLRSELRVWGNPMALWRILSLVKA